MQLVAALKRAASLATKGDFIVIMPPTGGLQSKVAAKLKGAWVAWLIDEVIESPGCVVEVGALREGIKGKGATFIGIARSIGLPTHVGFTAGGYPQQVKCTPLINLSEWFPPWPLNQSNGSFPAEVSELIVEACHVAQADELRPELGCICLTSGGTYAGTEAQLARTAVSWNVQNPVLVPTIGFHKWPPGAFSYFFSPEKAYFQIGDELRAVSLPGLSWWPTDLVNQLAQTFGEGAPGKFWFVLKVKTIREAFKTAKKIADRRLIALGFSGGAPWIRVGDEVKKLAMESAAGDSPQMSWQIVLDGNRFLDTLKELTSTFVIITCDPGNTRAPIGFAHPSYFEAIYPLIAVE